MRFQKFLLILGLAVLFSVGLVFVGCGDDDDAPTGVIGSLNDPDFMAVQDQVEIFVDSTVQFLQNGLNSISAISSTYDDQIDPIYYGPVKPDSDYVNAIYTNGWHVAEVSRVRAGFTYNMRDSIQFYRGDHIEQGTSNIDSLRYSHRWTYMNHDTEVSHTDYQGANSFAFHNLTTGMAHTSGMHQLQIQNQFISVDSTVMRQFNFEANVDNVSVNETGSGWVQGCPADGSISATLTMTYQKNDNPEIMTTWNVDLTFMNGVMAATVSSGNVSWNYTSEVCDPVM